MSMIFHRHNTAEGFRAPVSIATADNQLHLPRWEKSEGNGLGYWCRGVAVLSWASSVGVVVNSFEVEYGSSGLSLEYASASLTQHFFTIRILGATLSPF